MSSFQRTGDAEAFARLVSRLLAPASGVAQQLLSDRSLVEDAVQEAFLRVVRNRARYDKSKAFTSWFYAILRNVCRDMLRSRARRTKLIQEAAFHRSPSVESDPAPTGEVLGLLDRLPGGERNVLMLRIVHDLTFRDVGAALGISEEAAKKRAQRGLKRLREKYVARQRRAAALASVRVG